jgi:hypothetical protein
MSNRDPGTEHPWSSDAAIAALSKEKFGAELAGAVADALAAGRTAIFHHHREDCGHGLAFEAGRYLLVDVQDGGYVTNLPPVASWSSREEFVEFWARQSDFTCSGAHLGAKLFYTRNPWERNNHRLTREKLEAFVAGKVGGR